MIGGKANGDANVTFELHFGAGHGAVTSGRLAGNRMNAARSERRRRDCQATRRRVAAGEAHVGRRLSLAKAEVNSPAVCRRRYFQPIEIVASQQGTAGLVVKSERSAL
jgi:hypothetical protein